MLLPRLSLSLLTRCCTQCKLILGAGVAEDRLIDSVVGSSCTNETKLNTTLCTLAHGILTCV
jgi:hypothetical protein